MTRIKKTRTGGPLGAAKKTQEGTKANPAGSKRVGKGKRSGSRQQAGMQAAQATAGGAKDTRLGSKKAIDLTPVAAAAPAPAKAKPSWPPTSLAAQKKALLVLEKDEPFMAQLEILEEGGVLPTQEQALFEQKLERYDWLLEQLGVEDDEDADDQEWDDLSAQGKSLKDEWL